MIDVEKFVAKRKDLGISQVKLCEGICTQSTLSKFERQRQIPSANILEKLCGRLGMTVAELDSEGKEAGSESQLLETLVFAITKEQFPQAVSLVEKHVNRHWSSGELRSRFHGLAALVSAVTSQSWTTTVTFAGQVLELDDPQHHGLPSQLAYLALTVVMDRHHDLRGAALYSGRLTATLRQHDEDEVRSISAVDYGILLLITLGLAEIYQRNHNYQQSNQWLVSLNRLAALRNSTDCLARAKLLAAQNALQIDSPYWQVHDLLNDAQAFARLHGNQTVEVQAAALLKQLDK